MTFFSGHAETSLMVVTEKDIFLSSENNHHLPSHFGMLPLICIDNAFLRVIIFHTMTLDRSLCAICAWRGDCNKKFMHGSGIHCPDYTRDLTIRAREEEKEEQPKTKGQTKKGAGIRFL